MKIAAVLLFSVVLLISAGCGRQPGTFDDEKSGQENPRDPESGAPPNQDKPDPDEPFANPGAGSGGDTRGNNNVAGGSALKAEAPLAAGQAAPEPVVIPAGKQLSVRLLEAISSKTASSGQSFEAELSAPVVVNGRTVLPGGSAVRGRVASAKPSGRLTDPGFLQLTLAAVRTPGGRWVEIRTTSVSAKGESHKKRNVALIGGGSGVGAVIGAIAGGGKGAAIGAASGAAAGTAGAYATGKRDVSFSAERKLSFSTVKEAVIQ